MSYDLPNLDQNVIATGPLNPPKRPRRQGDQIDRSRYICGWHGCAKAYGTLNHLNNHVLSVKHGPRHLPAQHPKKEEAVKNYTIIKNWQNYGVVSPAPQVMKQQSHYGAAASLRQGDFNITATVSPMQECHLGNMLPVFDQNVSFQHEDGSRNDSTLDEQAHENASMDFFDRIYPGFIDFDFGTGAINTMTPNGTLPSIQPEVDPLSSFDFGPAYLADAVTTPSQQPYSFTEYSAHYADYCAYLNTKSGERNIVEPSSGYLSSQGESVSSGVPFSPPETETHNSLLSGSGEHDYCDQVRSQVAKRPIVGQLTSGDRPPMLKGEQGLFVILSHYLLPGKESRINETRSDNIMNQEPLEIQTTDPYGEKFAFEQVPYDRT
jgi:hypothetical protein